MAAWFEERGAEPKITMVPYAHPSLRESLGQAGFRLKTLESLLVADLPARTVHAPALPAGLTLGVVDKTDAVSVETYVGLASGVFFGESASAELVDSLRKCVLDPRSTNLLLRDGDTPVGVCGVDTFRDLGALWGGAIAPSHRRRGLQRLLIERRLDQLRDRGLRWATIASEPEIGTERNALRAGMVPAYARLEMHRPGEGLVPSP